MGWAPAVTQEAKTNVAAVRMKDLMREELVIVILIIIVGFEQPNAIVMFNMALFGLSTSQIH